MKESRLQFSKLLTVSSLLLFVWALLKGFTTNFSEILDTTVYVTSITVSGGIFGMCVKSYMSKAKAENIYKVQRAMYEDIMKVKLQYNEEMMKLNRQYNMTQNDVDIIDSSSLIDDNDVLNDMKESINNHLYDTKTEDDINNF
jgi:hypothetical protein